MPSVTLAPSLTFEPLTKNHDRNAFSCGNQSLDHYLQKTATQDARRNIAAPFVLIDAAAPKTILGYYTLSAFSVRLDELPPEVIRRLPSYPNIPATLLGRLAVDSGHQNKGYGRDLLMDALRRARDNTLHVASYAVVVDAIDESAVNFYRKHEFLPLRFTPDRLYLPMATISKL